MRCIALNEITLSTELCGCGSFAAHRTTLYDLFAVQYASVVPVGYLALNTGYGDNHVCFHIVGCVGLYRIVEGGRGLWRVVEGCVFPLMCDDVFVSP